MRRFGLHLLLLTLALTGCSIGGRAESAKAPVPSSTCGDDGCVRVRPLLDSDGAPLTGATVLISFDAPIKLGATPDVTVGNAVFNMATRQPEITLGAVKAIHVDERDKRLLTVEVDRLLADGASIVFGPDTVLAANGAGAPPLSVKLKTPWSPLAVTLAGSVWEPTDKALFLGENAPAPHGVTGEGPVRAELEARLRLRPGRTDEQVKAILGRYDDAATKTKVASPRLRAGLLMLTGTSAAYAIDFILASTNRRGVPFEPVLVERLADIGAAAAVGYHPLVGKLQMWFDPLVVADTLEAIATVFSHETLHSSLGGGSGAEETLAMAADTRIWEEFLLIDPALARTPTALTHQINRLTLALRNSGRYNFPRAGLLPRPGVDDALGAISEKETARSFKDLLFKADFYGDIPKAGDVGSEVLEAYYRTISGNHADQGHLKFDQSTLKLFDQALDNGFSDEQVLAIADALKLRAVPAKR